MCTPIAMARGQIKYGLAIGLCSALLISACAEQPLMERVDEELIKEQSEEVSEAVAEVLVLADQGQADLTVAGGNDSNIEVATASDI